MATTTIIYKSVILQPGEQFTLPPNSEIIAAEDAGSIESTCILPELATLECFTAVIGSAQVDGSESQLFEAEPFVPGSAGGNMTLLGVSKKLSLSSAATVTNLSGSYIWTEPYGVYDGTANTDANLKAELDTLIPEGSNISIKQVNAGDRGLILYVTLKTIASAISNVQLLVRTNFGASTLDVLVPFYLTSSSFIQDNFEPPTCS